MIAIIDYGVGNLFSLDASFRSLGAETVVTGDAEVIRSAERIVLPGVGAFADAAAKLRATGLDAVVCAEAAAGKPLLGICLGMQMLFERSHEYGTHKGLGLIKGEVCPIAPVIGAGLKVPHIGWNSLDFPAGKEKSSLFRYTDEGAHAYFVHPSAAMGCDDAVLAPSPYGVPLTAAAARDNVFGPQFHPEKSGDVGLRILRAFCEA